MWKIIVLIFIVFISGCSNDYVKIDKRTEAVPKELPEGGIGKEILIDDVSYTVTKIETYSEIGKNSVSRKADGLIYLFYLSIYNGGSEDYLFSPKLSLLDGIGRKYDQDLKSKFYLDGLIEWDKTVKTGTTHSGIIVFDIPEDSNELKLEIKNGWISADKVYFRIPESNIVFMDISAEVRNARESELLKANIN
jgi:hypothetical protein